MTNTTNSGPAFSSIPFRVGAATSRTFEIFFAGFGRLFVLALIPMIPLLVIALSGAQPAGVGAAMFSFKDAIVTVVGFVLGTVANATVLFGVFEIMRGESFTIGQSLRVGLARTLPVCGVSIVAGIATGLAMIALIVPGFIVLCMLYVAVPACVIEKLGVGGSLSRSAALTKGYRWPIFGLLLIFTILAWVVGYAGTSLVRSMGGGMLAVFEFGWQVIATAFGAVLSAVIYHDLRVAKEGVDISKLANVFD